MIDPSNMLQQAESYPVAFLKFTRVYDTCREKIFCFHEGEMDDKYYSMRIEPNLKSDDVCYCFCKGKDNVKKIYSLISKNLDYNNTKVLYLVDSDFDKSMNIEYIYETPYYSIENFYVTEGTLKKIIDREFYVYPYDENYNIIISKFEMLQKEFHEAILDLNTWIYIQRSKEKQLKQHRKLHLDTLKYNEIYSMNLHGVEKKYDLNFLNNRFSDAYTVSISSFNRFKEIIRKKNPCEFFRGKFEFHFMCSFLELIIEEYNRCKKGHSEVFKKHNDMRTITLNVSSKSEKLLSTLSLYAYTPECLHNYIKKMKVKFDEVS